MEFTLERGKLDLVRSGSLWLLFSPGESSGTPVVPTGGKEKPYRREVDVIQLTRGPQGMCVCLCECAHVCEYVQIYVRCVCESECECKSMCEYM